MYWALWHALGRTTVEALCPGCMDDEKRRQSVGPLETNCIRSMMVAELERHPEKYRQYGYMHGQRYERFSNIGQNMVWGTTEDLEIAAGCFGLCIFLASDAEGLWTVITSGTTTDPVRMCESRRVFLYNSGTPPIHWEALSPAP